MNRSALVPRMALSLGLLPEQVRIICRSAPFRYKKFFIKKKNGSYRQVAQPAREVKALQYFLIAELEHLLPIHNAAMAYRVGRSIRQNAASHLNSKYLLKLDFEGFFPSIKKDHLEQHLRSCCSDLYSDDELGIISNIVLWAPARGSALELCIGAPSSPLISNSIMFEFDKSVVQALGERAVSYTRYADDLTFSSMQKGELSVVEEIVRAILKGLDYPALKLNEKKTIHCSMATRREVTGVVLTPTHRLSVGRERKRLARAMYHRFASGRLDGEEVRVLRGLLAFIDEVEPGFSRSLEISLAKKILPG